MNEKEKKAIERMQEVRDKNIHTFVDELTIVLNLIEKQQARIDELEKALIDEDFKYKEKIKQIKDKLEKDIKDFEYTQFAIRNTFDFRNSGIHFEAKRILDVLEG